MGKRCCRFRFRLDLRRGLVHVQVLGWKRGARDVIQVGIQFKEMGIDGDPTQGKRKGEETSNRMVNTKSAKGKQSHQPPTSKKKHRNTPPTSNMHYGVNVASSLSLLIDIIPPPSFNGNMALPPHLSFLVRQQGLLIAYWLLSSLTSVCRRRRRDMGGRGKLDLR